MGARRTINRIQEHLKGIFDKESSSITKEEFDSARVIVDNASAASDIVLPYAKKIAVQLGLTSDAVKQGPIKELYRIFEKAIAKLDRDLSQVPDVGRLRILIEKPEDIENLRKMFLGQNPRYEARYEGREGCVVNKFPSNNIKVTEFEDFYLHPSSTGRVALHIGLEVCLSGSKAVPFEIQVIHKDMQFTEDFTHDNYQKASAIQRNADIEGRNLTDDEKQSVREYQKSNEARYAADIRNYGLINLMHQSHHNAQNYPLEYND